MIQRNSFYFGLPAVLIDAATFITFRLVSPWLVGRFSAPDGWNALIVGGVFLLFAVGVFLFRRLIATPQGSAEWLTRGTRVALALAFAFVISLSLAWQLGFFASSSQVDVTQMGEGGSASYFVFGPGAWLAFSLIYVLIFAFNVEPSINMGSGYWIACLFGLLTTAAMLVVFAAQAQVIMLQIGAVWWALLAFLVLALLFLPPRLLYLSRTVGVRSPVAYAVIAALLLLLAAIARQVATV